MSVDPGLTPTFADDEECLDPLVLNQTLHEMGVRERAKAFASGLSVLVVRVGRLVKLHPDGREEDLGVVPELRLVDKP